MEPTTRLLIYKELWAMSRDLHESKLGACARFLYNGADVIGCPLRLKCRPVIE